MTDDPLPPVEDLLRAHAEARRQAFGTPPAIPGHVRNRLQREVSALATSTSHPVRDNPRGWWIWLLRPLPWAGIAALTVGVWVLYTQVRSKQANPVLVASTPPAGEPRVSTPAGNGPPAAPAPAMAPVADALTAAGESPRGTAGVAPSGASLTSAPQRGMPAPAPTSVRESAGRRRPEALPAPAPTAAADSVPHHSDRAAEAEGAPPSLGRLAATRAAPPPAPAKVPAMLPASDPAVTVQQRFLQSASTPVSPVLNAFQIEQVGSRLQFLDADGSVYPIEVQPAGAGGPTGISSARPVAGRSSSRSVAPASATTEEVEASSPGALSLLVLNAMGTNRQLQQRVLFHGNLMVTNASVSNWAGVRALLTNRAALQQLLSNSRVQGQATVGASNQHPILAVPVGP